MKDTALGKRQGTRKETSIDYPGTKEEGRDTRTKRQWTSHKGKLTRDERKGCETRDESLEMEDERD